MKTRDYYFAKGQTVADSGVFTLTIPVGLKIQDIRVIIASTNGATSNTVGKLCGMVTKIEVLNGSDVLYSLSGREAQAYFAFNQLTGPTGQARLPFKLLSSAAAVVVTEEFPVIFGRYFRDPLYYLDTSRYQNPVLRITYAMTISATAGFATGTTTISALARIIDADAPPYQGFVMAKEISSYTTAASGDNDTLLPLDWPYCGLLISALKTTIDPTTVLTNFKLLVNAGQYIPFDIASTDLRGHNWTQFGEFEEYWVPLSDTTATFLSDVYSQVGAWPDIAGATGKMNVSSVTAESVVVTFTTGQAAGSMRLRLRGLMPQASWFIPFGDGDDPTAYLPVQGVSELRFKQTQAVAAGAATIVTQQLRQ